MSAGVHISEVPAAPLTPLGASELLDLVEQAMHPNQGEWLFLRELRVGTGRRNGGAQRLDGFALNCLPHQAMKRVCYEVKTSRADFLCEMRQPLKRRIGMRYSNEFYFLTPGGLLDPVEIPAECGLVEAGRATPEEWRRLIKRHSGFFHFDPTTGGYCLLTVPAPWRDTPGPTWQLVAAMLRNQRNTYEERLPERPSQQRLTLV